jgi:hypothetical protein
VFTTPLGAGSRPAQRENFGTCAVHSKRDRGPSRWLPPNAAAHCEYAAAWSAIASAYALSLDQADTDTINRILAGC